MRVMVNMMRQGCSHLLLRAFSRQKRGDPSMHKYQIKDVSLPLCGEDNSLFVIIRTPRWSLSQRDKMGHPPPSSPATTLLLFAHYYTPSPNLAAADDSAVTMWQIQAENMLLYPTRWRRQCSNNRKPISVREFAQFINMSVVCTTLLRQQTKGFQIQFPVWYTKKQLLLLLSGDGSELLYFSAVVLHSLEETDPYINMGIISITCRGWT